MKHVRMFPVGLLLVTTITFADESNPATRNLSQGLVGHWTFDGDLYDVSGYGRHGKFSQPVFAPDRHGKKNGAWQGNGRSGSVNVADAKTFDMSDSLTLSAWINLVNYVDAKGDHGMIISKWFGANSPRQPVDNGQYFLTLGEDGRLIFLWANFDLGPKTAAVIDSVSSETMLPKNEWIHVAVTFRKGQATLYVGGRRDMSKQSKITSFTQREYRHDNLRIGAHLSTAGTPRYILKGAIDDVRIYNRALSDDEITALANTDPVDETLQYFLNKSSLVVEGKITRIQKPVANDLNTTDFEASFQVSEVLSGPKASQHELNVRIVRRGSSDGDSPKISAGSKWILFLKPTTDARHATKWQTVDPWFGATLHSTALVDSLRQLRDAEAEKLIAVHWAPQLDRVGIGWDQASVVRYLKRIQVPADVEKRVAELVEQLDADEYRLRDEAQKQLTEFGALARPAVSRVAIEGSFEAKERARAILESPSIAHNESALVALMRVIALRPSKDCVPLLVGILPHCVNRSLETTAKEALADVATAADLPYLKRVLDESGPQTQCIVVGTVARLLGTARASEIYEMLQSKNAEVRFATVRALLDLGDRKCLSVLIDLLDNNDLCGRAAATLKTATGKSFGFDEELTPERRREAIAAWKKWLVQNGEHADLRFPIQLPDETVTSGLVLHYTFSHSGEQIQDRSGNGHHGVIHGSPKRVDSIIGKALSLDGKLDYIDTGLKYSDSLKSFCMWITSDFKSDRAVIPFGVQDPVEQRFYFGFDKGGDLGLGLGTSMFANESSRNLSSLDTTWHHYALTWNDSTMNLYVDGVLCATKTGTAKPKGNYFVGQLNRPKLPENFSVSGLIDDVRFYDRILSENEITTLFQLGNAETRSD